MRTEPEVPKGSSPKPLRVCKSIATFSGIFRQVVILAIEKLLLYVRGMGALYVIK